MGRYDVPLIPYECVPNFLKYSPEMNLGEVLGVAVNSRGYIMVLNHPGSASNGGPLYRNATSQLLEFDYNRRIQVFDSDGNLLRIMLLNVPYDKTMQPVPGNVDPDLPDAKRPWSLCITPGDPQYLWAGDEHPGRIYKLTLDGELLGMLGEAGRQLGQFNWLHGIDCSQEGVLHIADLNNRRVQKLILNP